MFNSTEVKLHNFYGSTECGGIAYDADNAPRSVDAFAGAPMRNVSLSTNSDGPAADAQTTVAIR